MTPNYFFELSGEHNSMPLDEALKCIEAESNEFKKVTSGPGYLIASFEESALKPISERISLTHNIGRHLCSFDVENFSLDNIEIPEGSFAIRGRRFEGNMKDVNSQDLIRKIGNVFSKTNDVKLKDPDFEIHMVMSDKVHLFLGDKKINRNVLETRKVGERPFFSPISLHPRFARALINLSGAKKGDRVLDPFCGTGGIAIEAAFMGMKPLISDFDENMVIGTQENMDFYNLKLTDFETIDISKIGDRFGEVDVIVTDPPYGRSTHTGGEEIESIYRRAMIAFREVLKVNGTAGVVLPYEYSTNELEIQSHHIQRVHGSLSRHYHVFKKTIKS